MLVDIIAAVILNTAFILIVFLISLCFLFACFVAVNESKDDRNFINGVDKNSNLIQDNLPFCCFHCILTQFICDGIYCRFYLNFVGMELENAPFPECGKSERRTTNCSPGSGCGQHPLSCCAQRRHTFPHPVAHTPLYPFTKPHRV